MQYNIKQFILIQEFFPTIFYEMQPIALIVDKILYLQNVGVTVMFCSHQ
jgi:hypothetical protein